MSKMNVKKTDLKEQVDASQAVTNTTGTSPKTGVDSTNTVPFAGAAVVLLGAAAVVAFRKKNV